MYLLNYVNAFTAYTLILVSFAMIGKFGVSAAYGDVYINTGELFFLQWFEVSTSDFVQLERAGISSYVYHIVSINVHNQVIVSSFKLFHIIYWFILKGKD